MTTKAALEGLNTMARHLKSPPEIDKVRAADWCEIFSDLDDPAFMSLVRRAIKTFTFFPSPGEFHQLIESDLEDRVEVAWLYAIQAMRRSNGGPITLDEVAGDGRILWAMGAVGRDAMECMGHAIKPEGHEHRTRATFARMYRVAFRYNLALTTWDRSRVELPTRISALTGASAALEVQNNG